MLKLKELLIGCKLFHLYSCWSLTTWLFSFYGSSKLSRRSFFQLKKLSFLVKSRADKKVYSFEVLVTTFRAVWVCQMLLGQSSSYINIPYLIETSVSSWDILYASLFGLLVRLSLGNSLQASCSNSQKAVLICLTLIPKSSAMLVCRVIVSQLVLWSSSNTAQIPFPILNISHRITSCAKSSWH